MPINVHFAADTAEELHQLVKQFTQHFPGHVAPAPSTERVVSAPGGKPAAVMRVVPEPVADAEEGAPEPDPEVESIASEPEPEVKKPRAAKKDKPAETKAAAGDKVEQAKAKEEAIAILQRVFGRAPVGPKEIKALQQKFGVAKFVDVPLDQADDLLTAAKAADQNTESFAA
jgi:hypothetical protein